MRNRDSNERKQCARLSWLIDYFTLAAMRKQTARSRANGTTNRNNKWRGKNAVQDAKGRSSAAEAASESQ